MIAGASTPVSGAITSTSTGGTWANATTWVGGIAPKTTDDVIIATTGANVVTVGTSTSCASLSVNSGSRLTLTTLTLTVNGLVNNLGTISISSGRITQSGTGDFTNGGTITYTGAGRLYLTGSLSNTGTLTLASARVYFTGSNSTSSTVSGFTTTGLVSYDRTAGLTTFTGNVSASTFTITAGTLSLGTSQNHTFSGVVTLTGGTLMGGSSNINANLVGTAWTNSAGVFTAETGTVTFGGAGNQTLAGTLATTFNNISLSNSGAKTIPTTAKIYGVLSMEGSATVVNVPNYQTTATLQYKNITTSRSTNNIEFPALFSGSGGVIIDPGIGKIITLNASKTGILGDLNVKSGTLDLSIYAINRSSAGGTLTLASGAMLRIGGTNSFPTNYSTHNINASSTIEYYGTAQTIATLNSTQSYGNLILSTSGNKTLPTPGELGIAGNLTVSGSATVVPGVGTVNLNNAAQTVSGTMTFNNLTISGSGSKTLTTSQTVNGILSFEETATVSAAPTFGAASTIQYYGTSRTTNNNEFPALFAGTGGVIINPGANNTITLNASKTTLKGNLSILSGTLDLSTSTMNSTVATKTLTLASGAILKIGGANTLPSGYLAHSFDAASTVEYYGTAQTVKTPNSSQTYGNLTLSGSGAISIETGVTAIAGDFTLAGTASTTLPVAMDFGGNFILGSGTSLTAGALQHSIAGNFENNGAIFTTTGSTFTFDGTTVAQTIGGTTSTTFNNIAFNNFNGVSLNIGETVSGSFTIGSGATVTLGSLSHNLGGNFANNGGTLDATGSTLTLNGGSAQTIGGTTTSTFNDLVFNNASGVTMTIGETFGGDFTINSGTSVTLGSFSHILGGNFSNNGGTLTATGSTLTLNGGSAQTIGGTTTSTFNNLAFNNTNGVSMNIGETMSGSFTIGSGVTVTLGGFSHNLGGNFANNGGALDATGSTLTFNGSSAQTIGGTTTTTFNNLVFSNSSGVSFIFDETVNGTFTISSGANVTLGSLTHNFGGNFANNGGILNATGSTLTFNGGSAQTIGGTTTSTFNNLSLSNASGVSMTIGETINGTLTVSTGASFTTGAFAHSLKGNFVNNGSTFTSTGSTLTFNGTTAQTIGGSSTSIFNNLAFSNTSGVTMTIGETVNGTFTIGSGASVTLGSFAHNLGGNFANNGGTLNATGSSLTLNGSSAQTIGGTSTSTFNNMIFNNTSGVTMTIGETISGNLTIGTGVTVTLGSFSHNLGGNFANNGGTLTSTGSTLICNGSSAQTIGGTTTSTFNILTLSNTSGVSMTIGETINGIFTLSAGASFTTGAFSHTLKGNFVNNGTTFTATGSTLIFSGTSAQTIGGTTATTFNNLTLSNASGVSMTIGETINGIFTLSAGASFTTGSFSHTLKGNFVNNGTTFTATGSTLTFSGTSAQTIGGSSATTFNNLTLSNANGVSMTIGETINGTFTLSPGASFTTGAFSHTLKGNFVNNGTTFTATGSTLTFSGTSAQTIGGTTATAFNNLTLSNASGVSMNIGETINGIFTLSAGASFTAGSLSHTFKGDFTNNGSTLNTTGSTLIFNGTSTQIIGGTSSTTFNNLTIDNTNGVTLTFDQTVNGALTLTNGLLNTGSITLTVGCSGSIANASAARYVNGKLALIFCGTGSRVFPIGKGGNYRPLTLNYTALTGSSIVTAEQLESSLPGTIPGDITLFGSRYWQLSQTGGSSYSFILTLDGTGWSPTSYPKILKGDGLTNTHYAATTPNYSNATAFTSFGNFGLGQLSFVSWLGSTSDWFTTSNWTSGSQPNSSDEIHIPYPSTNYPSISGTSPDFDVVVASSGKLQVDDGASLTLENGPLLTFQSGATVTTGTGSKIVLKSGARYLNLSSSTPTLEIQRQLTDSKGWRMLSSPVATTFSDIFKSPIVTQGFTGSSFSYLQPNLLWWDETDPGTILQSWRQPSNLSESTVRGRGYFLYNFNGAVRQDINGNDTLSNYSDALPITLSATGTEHFNGSGNFNYTLTCTNRTSQTPSAGNNYTYYDLNALEQGWNLLGNPTASTLDWNANSGWTKSNITDNTIYVWDPVTSDYLIWNGSVGTLGNGRIAPFQAFWVHVSASTTLSFTNIAKTATAGTFLKSAEVNESISLPITLSVGNLKTTSFITFSENGITGPDRWDGYRLEPMSDDRLDLYTLSSTDFVSPLVINNLPFPEDDIISIPLYCDAKLTGAGSKNSFTLKWELPSNWPSDWKINIQDNTTEESLSMIEHSTYSFSADNNLNLSSSVNKLPVPQKLIQPMGSSLLRSSTTTPPFSIVISKGGDISYLAPKPLLMGNLSNPFKTETTIRFSLPQRSKATVEIYSAQGQKMAILADGMFAAGTTELRWNANNVPPGIYYIRFKSGEVVETKKAVLIN
jgi:hypothetical protein